MVMAPTAVPDGWTGLRHLQWVRVVVNGEATRAEAVGIGHRHPRTVPITLALAARLVGNGTPVVILRADAVA
jgi:hypothetical protein